MSKSDLFLCIYLNILLTICTFYCLQNITKYFLSHKGMVKYIGSLKFSVPVVWLYIAVTVTNSEHCTLSWQEGIIHHNIHYYCCTLMSEIFRHLLIYSLIPKQWLCSYLPVKTEYGGNVQNIFEGAWCK
jgi:hypothetical protein